MLLKKWVFLFLITSGINVSAQMKDLPDSLRQLVFAARFHSGFIFAHNTYVQNTKGIRPNGFEFEYAHLHSDSAEVAKFKCYPRTGFSFTYIDFNSALLGRSYSAAYFLEPNFRLDNKLKMNLSLSSGLSYLTNPFNSVKNPKNLTYSGHINMFFQFGLGLSYPLNNHIALYAKGNFFHNSNGGLKLPNAGLNYLNASLGLQYYTYSTKFPVYDKERDTSWKHQPVHIDVSLHYSPKGGYKKTALSFTSKRRFVLGTSVQFSKQVSRMDAITGSAEIYHDDALRSIKRIFRQDSSSNIFVGLLVGHQFLLNRFTLSQDLGLYVFKQTKKYNETYQNIFHTLYQRWGLSYKVKGKWSVGINILAHVQIADFIDGRVIYRFK